VSRRRQIRDAKNGDMQERRDRQREGSRRGIERVREFQLLDEAYAGKVRWLNHQTQPIIAPKKD
jgi:hypothetical protein